MDFHHILSTSHLHSSTTAPVPFPNTQPNNTTHHHHHHHQLPGISYFDSHQAHSYHPSQIQNWYNATANITSYPLPQEIPLATSSVNFTNHRQSSASMNYAKHTDFRAAKSEIESAMNPALARPIPREFSTTLFPYSIQTTSSKGKPRNKRTFISQAQVKELEKIFEINNFPTSEVRSSIAEKLGLSVRSVQIWFQNRRQGRKKQQLGGGQLGTASIPISHQTAYDPNFDALFPYSKGAGNTHLQHLGASFDKNM